MRSIFPEFSWLRDVVPGFPVNGDQISILYHPEDFYKILLESCLKAEKRIILASLYIGNAERERSLVNAICQRASECDNQLNIKILLDGMRGSRGKENSRKILMPLVTRHPHSQISLYHTPVLRGMFGRFIPQRYNELFGLQHMKFYVIDNTILITGANLSTDYFTNRQDRYILIKNCKQLSDFYENLFDHIDHMCYKLKADDTLSKQEFNKDMLKENIKKYYASFPDNSNNTSNNDTWIFPLLEIPPLDIHFDSLVVKKLLQTVSAGSVVDFATGYFNITEEYGSAIINSTAMFRLLLAHPLANGFLNAPGPAGYIPMAYTSLAGKFLKMVDERNAAERVSMWEFQKKGWTFHGKGLWFTRMGKLKPSVTIIGSSNYGSRSMSRDLECQLVIGTKNVNLKELLHKEKQHLFRDATVFNNNVLKKAERKPPFWINWLTYILRSYF